MRTVLSSFVRSRRRFCRGSFVFLVLFLLPAGIAEAQPACSGNGVLNPATGECLCNTGFSGPTCGSCAPDYYNYPSCKYCNAATTCNGNGTCDQFGRCSCRTGFEGEFCSSCADNYYSYPACTYCYAPSTCSGNGVCGATGQCSCFDGFGGSSCASPRITCLNPTVSVPSSATTCTTCPPAAEIYSVQDPSTLCTLQPNCPYPVGTNSVLVSCVATNHPYGRSETECPIVVTEPAPRLECPDVTVACTGGLPDAPRGTSVCSQAATTCVLNTGAPWAAGAALNGAVSYSCTASTAGGSTSCTGALRSTDLPPSVSLEEGLITLWPANHKMQTVELTDCVSGATDACTGQPIAIDTYGRIVRVTSDERDDDVGVGDGQTSGDIQILSATNVALRRERDGAENGRVYTIYFEISNGRGGVSTGTCQVGVPHSANSAPPTPDAPKFCVGTGC